MDADRPPGDAGAGCCDRALDACVFDKALLARTAGCSLVQRRALAEREWLACGSPPARINCETLLALLRERSTFALRLPRGPVVHAQALRLQCGGLHGIRRAVAAGCGAGEAGDEDHEDHEGHEGHEGHVGDAGDATPDVHRLVGDAQQRFGRLAELPWDAVVREVVAWPPRRRHGGASR